MIFRRLRFRSNLLNEGFCLTQTIQTIQTRFSDHPGESNCSTEKWKHQTKCAGLRESINGVFQKSSSRFSNKHNAVPRILRNNLKYKLLKLTASYNSHLGPPLWLSIHIHTIKHILLKPHKSRPTFLFLFSHENYQIALECHSRPRKLALPEVNYICRRHYDTFHATERTFKSIQDC